MCYIFAAVSDQLSQDLASLQINRTAPPPRNTAGVTKWLVVAVCVAGLGFGAKVAYPYVEAQLFKTEVSSTEILSVTPSQASTVLSAQGFVVAQSSARVSAKLIGRISQMYVTEGQQVALGDKLFELDDIDQQAAIAAANAKALAARAAVASSQAAIEELDQQITRMGPLVERGASARSQLDDLIARRTTLRAGKAASEAQTRAAQAEVAALRVNASQFTVTAPIAGTVVTDPAEVGEMITPELPVLELSDMASLLVEVDVPEPRLHLVERGSPCEIVLDAFPGKRYRGETVDIGRRVDRAKATVRVKVRFTDSIENVLPEMSAQVSFLRAALSEEQLKAQSKVIVPRSAVVERGGQKVVFEIREGKVQMQAVDLGSETNDGYELVRGPEAGTKIVDRPPATLATGQSVKEAGAE